MFYDAMPGLDDGLELTDQHRQIVGENHPEDILIDGIVSVDQPLAQADDLTPRNLRVAISEVN